MHAVEMLEQSLEIARLAGYTIRQEWLGESQGGACVIKGKKFLFLDPTLSIRDQLDEVVSVLKTDPAAQEIVAARNQPADADAAKTAA